MISLLILTDIFAYEIYIRYLEHTLFSDTMVLSYAQISIRISRILSSEDYLGLYTLVELSVVKHLNNMKKFSLHYLNGRRPSLISYQASKSRVDNMDQLIK